MGARAVRVNLSGPGGEVRPGPLERELRARLQTSLEGADVRYEKQPSCGGRRAALLLSLDARYLDPDTYVGFPENAHTYVVTLQVGTLTAPPGEGVAEPLYGATTSDILPLAEGETAQLLEEATPLLRELAQTWREANVVAPLQYLLFAGIAVLLAAVRFTLLALSV